MINQKLFIYLFIIICKLAAFWRMSIFCLSNNCCTLSMPCSIVLFVLHTMCPFFSLCPHAYIKPICLPQLVECNVLTLFSTLQNFVEGLSNHTGYPVPKLVGKKIWRVYDTLTCQVHLIFRKHNGASMYVFRFTNASVADTNSSCRAVRETRRDLFTWHICRDMGGGGDGAWYWWWWCVCGGVGGGFIHTVRHE